MPRPGQLEANGKTKTQNRAENERLRGIRVCRKPFCDYQAPKADRLAGHESISSTQRRFRCTTCALRYCTETSYRHHACPSKHMVIESLPLLMQQAALVPNALPQIVAPQLQSATIYQQNRQDPPTPMQDTASSRSSDSPPRSSPPTAEQPAFRSTPPTSEPDIPQKIQVAIQAEANLPVLNSIDGSYHLVSGGHVFRAALSPPDRQKSDWEHEVYFEGMGMDTRVWVWDEEASVGHGN